MGINRLMMLMSVGLTVLLAMILSEGGSWIHRAGQETAMAASGQPMGPLVVQSTDTNEEPPLNPDIDTDLKNDTEDVEQNVPKDTEDIEKNVPTDTEDIEQNVPEDTEDIEQNVPVDTEDIDRNLEEKK